MKTLSVENSLIKAKSLSKKGQIDEGINILQSILKNFPNNIRVQKALQNLTSTHYNLNVKKNYEIEYDNLYKIYKTSETEKFLFEAEKILNQYPNAFMVWNLMGIVKAKKGDILEATNSFKKAVELNPKFADGFNNLGNILVEQGKFDEAIISFKNALFLKPEMAEAFNNIGNIFQSQGKFQNALENYKKAISINPNYIDALNNLGVSYHHLGKSINAIDVFKKAILLEPTHTVSWNNLAYPMHSIKTNKSMVDEILLHLQREKKLESQEINKNILKYKIFRSKGISNDLFNLLIKSLSKVKNITIKNPLFCVNSTKTKLNLPQKIISLVHFGRSGTGFFHSLIDNHPEISTLPSLYFSEYFDRSTWEKITINGWDSIVENFIKIYEVLFDARSTIPIKALEETMIYNIGIKEGMTKMGDNGDQFISVDKNQFRQELKCLLNNYEEIDPLSFFKLVHIAYERTLKQFNYKNIIFYHIHNPDIYAQLNFVQSDQSSNWIMMVREPIQNCESWLRYCFHHNDHQVCTLRITKMLIEIDNIVYIKNKSIGVRLEDLKKHPQKTIPALCKWMGIQENENLYKMTMQGKKWWGDPTSPDCSTDGMNPFGNTSIKRKIGSILSENDQFILSTFFYPFSVRFGYINNNFEKFKMDLQKVEPMIDKIFDFEKVIIERTNQDINSFMMSGSYTYLRSILKDRWSILNEFHTYPNMIKPLKIY